MKLRILSVHNRYLHRGGEDECREAECAMLRSRGHEVLEYTRDNKLIDLRFPFKIALRTLWSVEDYEAIRQLIRREGVDIVHVHNFLPLISPSAFYAAHHEQIPVVHTLHNYRMACPGAQFMRNGRICEDCLGKAVPWPGALHGCYRGSRVASAGVVAMLTTHRSFGTWRKTVSAYLVVSEFMRTKVTAAGLPPEKVFLKPNFAPDRGTGSGQGGYALFVGRLSEEKGLSTLLSAWKCLGIDLPLKIVGTGPLESSLRESSDQTESVQLLGQVPFEEVFRLIGDALTLIVPSRWYEGAPRVIVEALSRGTPVVASDLGGMAEIIEHERSGLLFPPGDFAALASSVRRLVHEPGLAARLRNGAREKFLCDFTEDRNYELLTSIYSRLIGGSVASAINTQSFQQH